MKMLHFICYVKVCIGYNTQGYHRSQKFGSEGQKIVDSDDNIVVTVINIEIIQVKNSFFIVINIFHLFSIVYFWVLTINAELYLKKK